MILEILVIMMIFSNIGDISDNGDISNISDNGDISNIGDNGDN